MTLLGVLRERTPEMVRLLGDLVELESPSSDVAAVSKCAGRLAEAGSRMLGAEPRILERDGRPHLLWQGSAPVRVLVIGHVDTVWPIGTIDRLPFEAKDGIARGPGVFDMKAGLVQALFALEAVSMDRSALLITSDEELGSPTSRDLIEELARDAEAALVCEPSEGGALKLSRKGVSTYRITARGRAAHAGLDPWDGANALVEIAHQIAAVEHVSADGTTVVPTTAEAGTAINTVPALATATLDVRMWDEAEQLRIDDQMRSLRPSVEGVELDLEGGPNRPPLPRSAAAELFSLATRIWEELGLGALDGVEVGGASDGNYTAGVGTPTLDGLGPVGAGAHAEHEHVVIESLPERAALLASLILELTGRTPSDR